MAKTHLTAVDLMREIYEPLERDERQDFGAFFDALDEEVTLRFSVGELKGKEAVIAYFSGAGEILQFSPFDTPLEYFGDADRAVVVGEETFKVKDTGVVHNCELAWVYRVRDGRITHISAIQDLSGIAGVLGQHIARSQAAA
jgi:ketosteroid isomerase-like protein